MKTPDSFVPLTAAPAPTAPREFKLAIINGHSHAAGGDKTGFQSLEDRPSAGAEKKISEPRVTVQRDVDRVTHLRIQCSCGMILDLACVYDALQASA